jgi:hypothetical protein
MLTTVYQGGVLATAFRIPAEVVDLLSTMTLKEGSRGGMTR